MSNPGDSPRESLPRQSEDLTNDDDPQLDSIRSILFSSEQARIRTLEDETERLRQQAQTDLEISQTQIDNLQSELDDLRRLARQQRELADRLQTDLDQLRQQLQAESVALIPRLVADLSHIVSKAVQSSREAMADALGPVMGEAIRVQIRDSREEMVEALFPVILGAVQRAISEFTRELQRNIDARLKTTFRPSVAIRTFMARIRGVSPGEIILRDALPFDVTELFLIQHGSGLLVAHYQSGGDEDSDSDLIGGMLTAIRDFARDSFGEADEGEGLDEIQYGDERIIIESGQYVYAAAVVIGIEPTGFRSKLRQYVNELHIHHSSQLRNYTGDSTGLPDLNNQLNSLVGEISVIEREETKPLNRNQKVVLFAGGVAAIVAVVCACFYLQFTVALFPLAFGNTPTPAATASVTVIPSPTFTQTSSPSPTPSPSPIPDTPRPRPSATKTAAPTNTLTPRPSDTPLPSATRQPSHTIAPVWVRVLPELSSQRFAVIPADTPVTVFGRVGPWIEVAWFTASGRQIGWIPLRWVSLSEPITLEVITPTTTD